MAFSGWSLGAATGVLFRPAQRVPPNAQVNGFDRHSLAHLHDTQGFSDRSIYDSLAQARCKLIVMHSVQREWKAERFFTDPEGIYATVEAFFLERIRALEDGGIKRDRIIIDPGMGFFLGSNAEPSFRMLSSLRRLKEWFGLPIMICVSRKSFLKALLGGRRPNLAQRFSPPNCMRRRKEPITSAPTMCERYAMP